MPQKLDIGAVVDMGYHPMAFGINLRYRDPRHQPSVAIDRDNDFLHLALWLSGRLFTENKTKII